METAALASLVEPIWSFLQSHWPALFGVVVLAVFAAHHFNSPTYVLSKPVKADGESASSDPKEAALARTKIEAPPIFTTRRESYRRAQVKYIVALEAVFIFYVLFPELFADVAALLQVKVVVPEAEPDLVTERDLIIDRVIYGLFGLMGLYATFPGLSGWDRKIREKLHLGAIIPEDVKSTATLIFDADYQPPAKTEQAVAKAMAESPAQFDYEKTRDPLKLKWFRLSCAHTQLNETLRSDEFRRHRRFLSPEGADIDREYTQRQQHLAGLIAMEARFTTPDGKSLTDGEEEAELEDLDTLEAEVLLGVRKNLQFKIDVLYCRVCLLQSMMFLVAEKSADRIQGRFRKIGYDVEVPRIARMDWDSIIKTFLTISVVIFLPSLVYYVVKARYGIATPADSGITVPDSFVQTLVWSVNILVLHMLCLSIAMWSKHRLARQRAKRGQGRRRSKVVENAMVFGLCYIVTYLFGGLLFYGDHGLRVLWLAIPWAAVPALTGCFVGIYIDRVMAGQEVAIWRRFDQGILMGLFAAVASFLFTPPTPLVADIPAVLWLYVFYISGMQVLVGLGVSWIFPRSYRKRRKPAGQPAEDKAAAASPPLAAPA